MRVERASGSAWRALAGDDEVGRVRALLRPDARCFLSFRSCREDAYAPLLAAVDAELGRDLYVTTSDADDAALRRYDRLGFVVTRRESHFLLPTDPRLSGLGSAEVPPGFVLVRADQVDRARLRLLDDALRQDVPGTDGWAWDEAGFEAEFDASYDPATYLVAQDRRSGEHTGLARVWNNPAGPRLGLIAVLPSHRRRGLARALLAAVFRVVHERGLDEVATEVDDANVASTSLVRGLGARRVGGSVELVRRRGYPTTRLIARSLLTASSAATLYDSASVG